ncbi:MAG: hypothetical protein KC505_08605 [Myxococcales bacterium]|nr:hypothetical protein [Myxococcales bacterium]USN50591.1 MAG: hypothetical protein H6731_10065 [Myxococcales bacterium]
MKLFNVGGAKGSYRIRAVQASASFNGQNELEFNLEAKGHANDSLLIMLSVNPNEVNKTKEVQIRIASPESGIVNTFSDELIVYAGQ